MKDQAIAKIRSELTHGRFEDPISSAIKDAVAQALEEFCAQDAEFAQAVIQGGSFSACMKAVTQHCGAALSDLEAYRRAAEFYFPGAQVRFHMSLELGPKAKQTPPQSPQKGGIVFDLTAFL